MNKAEALVIHHSGVDSKHSQFAAIDSYHKSKGFPISSFGFYCGYTYHIAPNGYISRARLDTDIGAHTIGWNDKSISVALDGNFNLTAPTSAQIASLRGLIKEYDLPVLLHREAQENRTCPGRNFTKELLQEPVTPLPPLVEREKAEYIKMHNIAELISQFTGLNKEWLISILLKNKV